MLQQDESSLTIISLCRCTSVASRPETIMIQYLDILFYLVLFGGITATSWPRFVSSVTRSAAARRTTPCVMLGDVEHGAVEHLPDIWDLLV